MDTSCFDYCLTEDEHREFERNGFFVVENAIPPQMVKDLTTVVDRLGYPIPEHGGVAKSESAWHHRSQPTPQRSW